jgi:hypothetical protein
MLANVNQLNSLKFTVWSLAFAGCCQCYVIIKQSRENYHLQHRVYKLEDKLHDARHSIIRARQRETAQADGEGRSEDH